MTVSFWIPGPLRSMTDGQSHVDVETSGGTLQDALEALFAAHPGLRDRVLTEQGEVRQHVNVFVGNSEARIDRRTGDAACGRHGDFDHSSHQRRVSLRKFAGSNPVVPTLIQPSPAAIARLVRLALRAHPRSLTMSVKLPVSSFTNLSVIASSMVKHVSCDSG